MNNFIPTISSIAVVASIGGRWDGNEVNGYFDQFLQVTGYIAQTDIASRLIALVTVVIEIILEMSMGFFFRV